MTPIEVKLAGVPCGYRIDQNNGFFFFGFQNCTQELLKKSFPELYFYRAQQVHGNTCVQAPFNELPEADAVWTDQTNLAPTVITADCLPVMVLHPKFSLAIHAGWRGVLSEIVPKSVAGLINKFGLSSNTHICIGPHITFDTFEVGTDVFKDFQNKFNFMIEGDHFRKHLDPSKMYLNLDAIVSSQLQRVGLATDNITRLSLNTQTDPRLASFRRDRQKNLRNFSFVARLK